LSFNNLYESSRSGPFILAGPCVIENREISLKTASTLAKIADNLGLTLVFKSSFDKANRTSVTSFRGPGMDDGLSILAEVKKETGLPIVTDIHHPEQAARVAEIADVLQIPAFLCRQTDLLVAAAKTGAVINIKKGQFLAPWDMKNAVNKVRASGNEQVWLTERGATFGYNNLVVDMRAISEMKKFDVPVVFDATHSVQLPGGQGSSSGGQREYVPVLASAAVAAGADGVFMETHPDPDNAMCDGPNSLPLDKVEALLIRLKAIWEINNE
tara:strand:- start:19587 stop:20396 length:810 start_codon:yes stop_codon:yes gene_type:complete